MLPTDRNINMERNYRLTERHKPVYKARHRIHTVNNEASLCNLISPTRPCRCVKDAFSVQMDLKARSLLCI